MPATPEVFGPVTARSANARRLVTALALVSLLALRGTAFAQGTLEPAASDYFSREWSVDDGLPHNVVNRVVQDGRGFLWVATAAGLARFDGREFKEYPLPMAASGSGLNIRDLAMEDASTLLMLPASGGIVRLHDGVFSYHPANGSVAGETLLNLFTEPNGTLWLGLSPANVVRWQAGRVVRFGPADGLARRAGGQHYFATDGDGRTWMASGSFLGWYRDGKLLRVPVDTRAAIVIASARSGGLWVATEEQLLKWDNDRLTAVCSRPGWLPRSAAVQHMYEDRAGVLWIGTRRQGLFRMADGKPVSVSTGHPQIAALAEDAETNLWVSMHGGGIDRLRPKTFVLLDAAAGLPDGISTSVCEDASGAIWCADRLGGIVRMQAGQARVFSRTAEDTALYASNVCPDRDNNIWIGAIGGLYRIRADGTGPLVRLEPELQPVRALYSTGTGDMWVGSGNEPGPGFQLGRFHQGVYRGFSSADGFQGKHVVAIAEARDGNVWVGADDGELLEFRDGRFVSPPAGSGQPLGQLRAMHFDARGGLWIGTERGLVLRQDGRMRRFTRDDGLPDDFITQILEDNRGRLWLSSRRGFFCVALDELRAFADGRVARIAATTFGSDEGLPGMSAPTGGLPMAWKARDGRLWFVTNRGVVGFDPEASLPQRLPPAVYLDEVRIDHRPVPAVGTLRVPPGNHGLEFRFVALNYSAPEKVRLRHQLVGFDPDWVETTGERSASYARLPPGDFTLRVIAANQDGLWNNQGAALALTVLPAWWQTWWCRGAVLFGFTGLVVWLARYWSHRRLKRRLERLEREHALEQERARIARDLHDELGGSLTQIGLLADRLKRQALEPALKPSLGQLAWRTRRLAGELESIVWTVSPKNNTWDRLAGFIGQFVRGFCRDTALECSIAGDDDVPSLPLTPEAQHNVLAVLKEALTNVLKHSHATSVKVALSVDEDTFVLRLADNGVGFDPAAAEHAERNGLSNMRARVAELAGELDIHSVRGEGSEIVVRLRLSSRAVPAVPRPQSALR